MSALPVVVYLDVLEHLPPHGIPGFETLTMDRLNLQAMEEALGTGVIIAIAFGAHAAREFIFHEQ
tara:strand:- start:483 stop:677 length:195 start_codon:yes stop_codon:yes gene_type:complete